jgi:hypothetical protein
MRSGGLSGDRLYKGIQIESIKSSKRREGLLERMDNRQGVGFHPWRNFYVGKSCIQMIWPKSSHIFRMAFTPSNILHAFC